VSRPGERDRDLVEVRLGPAQMERQRHPVGRHFDGALEAACCACGVAPLPASSGMTQRHRLNRGGDRQANRALHMIVISRLRIDERIKAYAAKKTAEGHSKLEIIRCLKRLLAREIYYLLQPAATR
jgi:hypothetical protein